MPHVVPVERSVRTRAKSAEEGLLSAVESLQNQLRRTERNLQTVRTLLSSTAGREHSDSCFDEDEDLTIEDFVQLNHNRQCSSNCKKHVGNVSSQDFQRKYEISYLKSSSDMHLVSIPKSEEQIVTWQAEVSARDKIPRAERKTNNASLGANEATRVFQEYKEKISARLEKVQAEGARLESYIICSKKERENLNEKCAIYRKHLDIQEKQLRQLREENHNAKEEIIALEAKNSEMISKLNQSNRKIFKLEKELTENRSVLEEKNVLVRENAELRMLNAQQHNELKLCHQEMENLKQELNLAETILFKLSLSTSEEFNWHNLKCQQSTLSTKEAVSESCESNKPSTAGLSIELSMKEAEIGKSHTNLTAYKTAEHLLNDNERKERRELRGLGIEHVKLNKTQREKCQHLELVSKQFEKERQKIKKEVEKLRVKVAKLDNENLSLKTRMSQKTDQSKRMQEELSAKTLKINTLRQEMAKKSSQLSALKKELEEKAVAYSAGTARTTKLERELMVKNKRIHELEKTVSEKHKQLTSAFEKAKLIHLEQHRDMEKQIELEMKKEGLERDERLKILGSQLNEQTIKVKQLESVLDVSKEELVLYARKTEENKEMFQNLIKKKSEKCLKKPKRRSLQDMSEQNVFLQESLLQQQQMLQQETIRTGKLEDNQTKLEKQVSTLEQELHKQKVYAEDELRKVEEKLYLACQHAEFNRQKVDELNNVIWQKALEMNECKSELTGMEKEVVQLKQDIVDKAVQINYLDIALKDAQSELSEKTNEGLSGLQEALLHAHSALQEKQIAVTNLTAELMYCKAEIENKKQELLIMDKALKERNWELKERTAQMAQLDMAVHEHEEEMEQKIIQLECNLKKSELEVKECNKQCLESNLQHFEEELLEKDFELLQRDQEINQLREKMEIKQRSLEALEKESYADCLAELDAAEAHEVTQEQQRQSEMSKLSGEISSLKDAYQAWRLCRRKYCLLDNPNC